MVRPSLLVPTLMVTLIGPGCATTAPPTPGPIAVSQEPRRPDEASSPRRPIALSLPNRDWSVEVDSQDFVIVMNQTFPDGNRGLAIRNRDGISLSVRLSQGRPTVNAEYCRESSWATLREVYTRTKTKIGDVKLRELGQLRTVEYVADGAKKFLHAYFAKGGACVEMAVSTGTYKLADEALLVPTLGRVRITYDVAPSSPSPGDTSSVRSYELPNSTALELTVPGSWKTSISLNPGGILRRNGEPIITLLPPTLDDVRLLVSVFWPFEGRAALSPQDLRALLASSGQAQLSQAVEKQLIIEELRGREVAGYFYTLTDLRFTDRTPPSDQYRYMTQGSLRLGDWSLTFTILFNAKDAPGRQTALEIVKSVSRRQPR